MSASPSVSVLVPYRGGCPHREASWAYVRRWWADTFPRWEIVVGGCPGDGPWRKGQAVGYAAAAAHGDIAVVADADVICPGVAAAATAVTAGAPWAVPHRAVLRLTEATTTAVYAGEPLPDAPIPRRLLGTQLDEYHTGVAGGGITVLPRATLHGVPLDPRFEGWGQEDHAWAWALALLAGPAWRGTANLWHLWHPPAPRMRRAAGTEHGMALYGRYRATANPAAMRALLAEFR